MIFVLFILLPNILGFASSIIKSGTYRRHASAAFFAISSTDLTCRRATLACGGTQTPSRGLRRSLSGSRDRVNVLTGRH